jgi:tol-pal system protein YbgF
VTFRRFARLAPLAAVAAAGCFATRNDVRLLQADIARLQAAQTAAEESRRAEAERARVESARRDSVLRDQYRQIGMVERVLADSLLAIADGFSRFRANMGETMYQLGKQLATVQEIVGVSQKTVADIRSSVDSRREEQPPGGAAGAAAADTTGVLTPGPRRLYQTGMDQLQNGATGAARGVFEDFLKNYPADALVPDAMFQLADTYARDNADATADSVYALIVARYPKSARASTSLFKRAAAFDKAGRSSEARKLYEQLLKDYPGSDEASLALERKNRLPPP